MAQPASRTPRGRSHCLAENFKKSMRVPHERNGYEQYTSKGVVWELPPQGCARGEPRRPLGQHASRTPRGRSHCLAYNFKKSMRVPHKRNGYEMCVRLELTRSAALTSRARAPRRPARRAGALWEGL